MIRLKARRISGQSMGSRPPPNVRPHIKP
jgi:hypothetical protein